MSTSQIATAENRLRPTFVVTLVAVTFAIGIGAGFALSQVVAVPSADATRIHVLPIAGDDMSAAAYGAQHATTVRGVAVTRNDMTAAAYTAMHPAVVRVSPAARDDMSAAAYAALHVATGGDMSAAAYAARHDR